MVYLVSAILVKKFGLKEGVGTPNSQNPWIESKFFRRNCRNVQLMRVTLEARKTQTDWLKTKWLGKIIIIGGLLK